MKPDKIFLKIIIRIFIILVAIIIPLIVTEFIFKKAQFTKEFHNKIIDPEPYVDTVNEQGFRVRSENIMYDADRGEHFRIICLGDSFTFGHGVSDDKTYPIFLEKFLEHKWQREVQVINAGVCGVTITEEFDMYKNNCIQLQHNLVILLFESGDILDLSGELLSQKEGNLNGRMITNKYLQNSRIYTLLKKTLQSRDNSIHRYYDQHREEIISIYFELLSELNKTVQSKNAILTVVIFKSDGGSGRVKTFCIDEDITIIDIREEYAQELDKGGILLEYHHNQLGNRLLAKLIASKLNDKIKNITTNQNNTP